MKIKKLPAYPIFVKDPYFSFWSNCEKLNDSNLIFWHGETKVFYGTIEIGEKEYCFLGLKNCAEKLIQKKLEFTSFSTKYTFVHKDFTFKVEFISPLVPTDIELASCPVCYMSYQLIPKRRLGKVVVKLYSEERICYNTCGDENAVKDVRSGVCSDKKFQTAFMGLRLQSPLSHACDEVGADWGYYYVAGEKAEINIIDGRTFISAMNLHDVSTDSISGTILLAFDDTCSIFYFGDWLKGYYFRNGKTIFDALRFSFDKQKSVFAKCKKFDRQLAKDGNSFGDDYAMLLKASVRQIMGAHKIVITKNKKLLFLSKECNSDGCIATVDVSYPTFPMLKKYNPNLIKSMLYPIFDFAKTAMWEQNYAPHDAGVYPYCIGQFYGISQTDSFSYKKQGNIESLPYYYLLPNANGLYDLDKQMPVEECANMIILTALSADQKLMKDNYDLLKTWLDYLVDNGLIPNKQLCTDDFTGHLEKNANLSVKAIMGIKSFSVIADKLGNNELKEKYFNIAKDYAEKWMKLYVSKNCSMLSLDNENSYSMKYNLAIDGLLGEPLFNKEFCEKEARYYLTKANKYGIPLDSRVTYTKSDWMIWSASLSDDTEIRKKYVEFIVEFVNNTKDRVPFSDWYEATTADYIMFRNRSVLGGLFMFLIR